jgi:hypothetical protein
MLVDTDIVSYYMKGHLNVLMESATSSKHRGSWCEERTERGVRKNGAGLGFNRKYALS